MALQSYRDLTVWQRAMELCVEVYRVSADFPREERFGLVSQVRRSVLSIPANIAEGFGRESRGDFARFLRISQGSLKETETHLLLAERLGFVDGDAISASMKLAEETGKMTRALIASVLETK